MTNDNFWLEKWEKNELGFHLPQVHPLLKRYFLAKQSGTILVPLCGKSLDLLYLMQYQPVLGVELSTLACEQFSHENKLDMTPEKSGAFNRYHTQQLDLLQGNIFDLKHQDVLDCGQVYDRAALIALPQSERKNYLDHLFSILPRPIEYWLITLDYSQTEMAGPPYSVAPDEVKSLFQSASRIECLSRKSIIDKEPAFSSRGLKDLFETIYRIELM
ncbi:MAG: thiopurine S-methyltransferase [Gammaproteobacteria bacterium]|nr:thiopurine S-methyltransferase [Gammaproteobacteria bacterium]